jgi:hypothetical protein
MDKALAKNSDLCLLSNVDQRDEGQYTAIIAGLDSVHDGCLYRPISAAKVPGSNPREGVSASGPHRHRTHAPK